MTPNGTMHVATVLTVTAWTGLALVGRLTCRNSRPPDQVGRAKPAASVAAASAGMAASRSMRPRDPRWTDARHRMVKEQLIARGVRDARVLAAMDAVPRHWFVPHDLAAQAYDDEPLPIGFDQTISQPYIAGLMTELLAVMPGEKVLEIGTGSGYQAGRLREDRQDGILGLWRFV